MSSSVCLKCLRCQLVQHGTRLYSVAVQESPTSKLQAILRPFIFSVHPDLFGQHPFPKSVNESSLKALNEYIQSNENERQSISKQCLQFYQKIRSEEPNKLGKKKIDDLRVVKVQLSEDILKSVRSLLAESNLPLRDVDDYIAESEQCPTCPDRPVHWIHSHYFAATGKQYPFTDIWEETTVLKPAVTLHRWVSQNVEKARKLESSTSTLRRDFSLLQKDVMAKYSLRDVLWGCGWRGIHQLASLKKLNHLLEQEKQHRDLVAGKRIIFGNERGVTLHGDIALCSDEVPQQWSEMLSTVPSSDKFLELIPKAEKQLSALLNGIKMVRRNSPPLPLAHTYYNSLAALISKYGMARTSSISSSLSKNLEHLNLSVTGTMGDEITLTPQGHISVPSHSPVWAVNNFIRDNENVALEASKSYARNKAEAQRLMDLVVREYDLQSLTVASSISYDKVIKCCDNMLTSSGSVRHLLEGVRLCISPYFAVMGDGEMCIMWDWPEDRH